MKYLKFLLKWLKQPCESSFDIPKINFFFFLSVTESLELHDSHRDTGSGAVTASYQPTTPDPEISFHPRISSLRPSALADSSPLAENRKTLTPTTSLNRKNASTASPSTKVGRISKHATLQNSAVADVTAMSESVGFVEQVRIRQCSSYLKFRRSDFQIDHAIKGFFVQHTKAVCD